MSSAAMLSALNIPAKGSVPIAERSKLSMHWVLTTNSRELLANVKAG
jgi:hypothetical protein